MRSDTIFKYSYEQMERELMQLKQVYPGKISLGVSAFSVEGRKIYEAVSSREDAAHHILIQAGMHGREYMNSAVVMRQMRDYLQVPKRERYRGELLKQLYESVCFHVVPMVNSDGVMISQESPSKDGKPMPGAWI